MGIAFGLLSLVVLIAGVFNVNEATLGVFCGVAACWLAIMVRIHDADKQHRKLIATLERIEAAGPKSQPD